MRLAGAVVAALGLTATVASAQPVETNPYDHAGPAVSISVGAAYSADRIGGGVARVFMLGLGWFVTDRVALLVGTSGVTRGEDSWIAHGVSYLGAQYWVAPRWYLRAGFGSAASARLEPPEDGGWQASGPSLGHGTGALVAIGTPVRSWGALALNLQVVAGAARMTGDRDIVRGAGFVGTCLELAIQ